MTSRPLRALILGPLGPPFGGPEVMTQTLIDALAARGEIDFVHLNTQVSRSLAEKGGRHQLRKSLRAAWQCARLLVLLIRMRPDVAYLALTNSPSFLGFLRDAGMITLVRMTGCRVAVRLCGGYYYYSHTRGWKRKLVAAVLRRVDLALVQGSRLVTTFGGLIAAERIAVIPNGTNDRPFAAARSRAEKNGATPQILFVGLLCAEKGFHDVLAAIPDVPDANFVFMGEWASDGDRDAAMDRLAADGTASRVRFAGVVAGDPKYDIFVASDALVFPSYFVYEGHAVSTVEALAAGLPIVCTDHGALDESVRDGWNGFFVPPRDAAAIAEALTKLIGDESLRLEMGRRSRELYERRFTADRFIDAWSRAIVGVVGPRAGEGS